jgi:hypothetical protein
VGDLPQTALNSKLDAFTLDYICSCWHTRQTNKHQKIAICWMSLYNLVDSSILVQAAASIFRVEK